MNQWLERARGLAPIVKELRDQGEQQRRLPQPVFQAMRDAGLFSIWVPRALGGAEADVESMVEATEELSRQDGSVGWNLMIAGNTSILWAYLAPEAAAEMMAGDPNTVIAGTILAGSGSAVPAPSGYRVSGRWPFASGCHQADWLVAACTIAEGGEVRRNPDGSPQINTFVLPIADCHILDTWYTTGMRGTGSHDFTVDSVFVPERRHFASVRPRSYHPGPLYNTTIVNVWAPNVAAVAMGIARDAIQSFVELADSKRSSQIRSSVLADRETVWETVGEAESLLRSGRAFLLEAMHDAWRTLSAGGDASESQTATVRLAAATAVRNSAAAVDLMYNAAGSASIYAVSRLERCFRDVHMVTQHGVVGASGFGVAGRFLLGRGLVMRR